MNATPTTVECRVAEPAVALETTLILHGVPASSASRCASDLAACVREAGAQPALVGIVHGRAIVGVNDDELSALLDATARQGVPKANTANLGVLMHRGQHAATTVSTTMELAAAAGVRVFATGGIGGVHRGYGQLLDVSSDLAALARFPVAVVTSGVKSLLDVVSTREALETLGVPVFGYRTDAFPAFYLRDGGTGVDARFDDADELARCVRAELERTGRGVVVANPIPEEDELDETEWLGWLRSAEQRAEAEGASGRDVTPAVLSALHEVSQGRTLKANLALARANATLGGRIAASMHGGRTGPTN